MSTGFLSRCLQDGSPDSSNGQFFQRDAAAINNFPTTDLICQGPGGKIFLVSIDTASLPVILAVSSRWRVANFYPKKVNKQERLYAYIRVRMKELKRSRTVYLHRVIVDAPQGTEVDHYDHFGLNNRGRNLRVVTHEQNMRNRIDYPRNQERRV